MFYRLLLWALEAWWYAKAAWLVAFRRAGSGRVPLRGGRVAIFAAKRMDIALRLLWVRFEVPPAWCWALARGLGGGEKAITVLVARCGAKNEEAPSIYRLPIGSAPFDLESRLAAGGEGEDPRAAAGAAAARRRAMLERYEGLSKARRG